MKKILYYLGCLMILVSYLVACEGSQEEHYHTYGLWNEEVEATCNSLGVVGHYKCECGMFFDINHSVIDDPYIPIKEHTFEKTNVIEPTCHEEGFTKYVCSECGKIEIKDFTEALSHNYVIQYDWSEDYMYITGTATCSLNCGEIITESHKVNDFCVKSPTCTTEGEYIRQSVFINSIFEQQTVSVIVPELGHDEVIIEPVNPTCFESGLSEGKYCTRCNEVLVEQKYLAKLDHDFFNDFCSMCSTNYYTPGLKFELNGNSYKVSKGDCSEMVVIIPELYNGIPVKYIDIRAFDGYLGLKEIIIPASIDSIGFGAFVGCDNLEKITLPFLGKESVKSVNVDNWFSYIFGENKIGSDKIPATLTEIVLNGGTSIDSNAFNSCENIIEITLPSTIKNINECAFLGCDSLKNINIPNGLEYIGHSAFLGCDSLTAINIPN